ncbi:hypothetical protein R9C05_01445 [Metamycoplasma subdolum]|nr:hypothetical protein [Metamycoplasma subdolum]WPB50261.1 hypothetical protein R9C05_01445 [Metamycoplasma subdolum]
MKKKLATDFFFLFFSTFLFFSSLAFLLALNDGDPKYVLQFFHPKTTGQKLFWFIFLNIISIIVLLFLPFWFLSSLATILINRYFNFNIFRAIHWLKIKLIVTFKIKLYKEFTKPINLENVEEKTFVNDLDKNYLILHGSKAISYKYRDFWRTPNDLDFISYSIFSNLDNLTNYKNLKIEFKDNILAKMILNKTQIEILLSKTIPQSFIETKKNIKLPNIYWMIASNIHQILKYFLLEENSKEIPKEKVNNSLLDLLFLLSKKGNLNIKKLLKFIKYSYISNFFLSYYLINTTFYDFSEKTLEKLFNYLTLNIKNIENSQELFFLFDMLFAQIKKDKEIIALSKSIYEIIQNKEELELKFLKHSTAENKEISSLQRVFENETQKNEFIYSNYSNCKFKSKAIMLFYNNMQDIANNKLDIRKLLLLELNKRMELTNE